MEALKDLELVPTFDDIAGDLGRATDLTRDQRVALLLRCAAVQSALAASLLNADATDATSDGDRLLTIDAAAATLSVTRAWLYRRAKRLGLAVKLGDGTLRISASALQNYVRASRRRA